MSDESRSGDANPLVRTFLDRPVSVFMLFLALFVVGTIAYRRIQLELFPSGFQPRSLTVDITLPDSTPSEVEQRITRPLERILGTVAGLKSFSANSHANGCWARLQFDESVSIDDAYVQVRDRLDRISAEFPQGTRRPEIFKFNLSNFPVAFLAVSLRKGARPEQLRNESLIVRRIQNRLKRIPGIARVNYMGGFATSIDIDMSPEQVEGMGIDLYRLVQRMQSDNFTLSAGQIEEGDRVHYLRSVARFDSIGSLLQYPVRRGLRLGELANIQASYALQNRVVRINGLRSIAMELSKKSDANTVEVCRRMRQVIEQVLQADPQLSDFRFQVIWDQGSVIVESLDNLERTIMQGALVALLVLLLFLRSFRMTVVVMLAIPLSLLAALVAMYFLGETLNLLSLMGLTLGVGMLVDNSVVVVEGVRAQTEKGRSPRSAALIGTSRVTLAILIATSTTIVVFLPLMLTGESGQFRFLIMRLGLPVCLSLGASLAVAMVLIPPACRFALRGEGAGVRWVPRLVRAAGAWFDWLLGGALALLGRGYLWLLKVSLRRRLEMLLTTVLLLASGFWAKTQLDQTDLERGENRRITIRLRLPDQWTMYQAADAVEKVEARLLENKARLDLNFLFSSFDSRRCWLQCFLDEGQRKVSRKEVLARIKALMPELPGVIVRVGRENSGAQEEQAEFPIVLHGRDTQVLSGLADEVVSLLEDLPGMESVHSPLEEGQSEVRVIVDRELAQRYNVAPNVAAGLIAYTYRGQFLPKLRAGDREFYLRLQMDRDSDPRLDEVKALLIPTDDGNRVPLATIARFERHKAYSSIQREDRRTVLRIRAKGEIKNMEALGAAVDARMSLLRFPEGYGFKKEGRFEELEKAIRAFQVQALLAVALVFFLMGFLFESWLLPLAILISIPFAFFGVYWMLYLTSTPLEMMSFIGLIVLIGIVINNGVVLIDRVHGLRGQGSDRTTAILEGARERFRPILMTALTTIGGLLPMALGSDKVTGIPYYHLGRTVIGGLAASTFMTLLLVPVMYTLFDDLSRFGRGLLARRAASGKVEPR